MTLRHAPYFNAAREAKVNDKVAKKVRLEHGVCLEGICYGLALGLKDDKLWRVGDGSQVGKLGGLARVFDGHSVH